MERPGSPLASSGKPRLHAERFLLSLFIESLAEAAPAATEPVEDISWTQVSAVATTLGFVELGRGPPKIDGDEGLALRGPPHDGPVRSHPWCSPERRVSNEGGA